ARAIIWRVNAGAGASKRSSTGSRWSACWARRATAGCHALAAHWLDVNLRAGGEDDDVFFTRFFHRRLERLAPGTSPQSGRFPTPGSGYQPDGLVGLR